MKFAGTGKRLAAGDIGKVARIAGVETATLLALLEVETRGRGFDRKNRLKMLFEPHVFYRRLKGAQRRLAIEAGLAYKHWGMRPYPRSFDARYDQMKAAMLINRPVALESASWGLPQMMGFNYQKAGFTSAEQMIMTFLQGEYEQLIAMVTWLENEGIMRHMRGKDFSLPKSWIPVVKRYNGPGYRKNAYHIKAASAYRKHADGRGIIAADNDILRKGMKGEAVRAMQADLRSLGYEIVVDGRFGPATEVEVEVFQRRHGLKADGIFGPKTKQALEIAVNEAMEEANENEVEMDQQQPWWLLLLNLIIGVFK